MNFTGTFNLADRSLYEGLFVTTNRYRQLPPAAGYVIVTYAIVSKTTGKAYVGSTENFYRRWGHHLNDLTKGKHGNGQLQRIADLYGIDDLEISIIKHYKTTEDLLAAEYRDGLSFRPERDLLNIRLGSKYLNDYSPTALSMVKTTRRPPTRRPGIQKKTRWFDGQVTV